MSETPWLDATNEVCLLLDAGVGYTYAVREVAEKYNMDFDTLWASAHIWLNDTPHYYHGNMDRREHK